MEMIKEEDKEKYYFFPYVLFEPVYLLLCTTKPRPRRRLVLRSHESWVKEE